MGHKISKEQIDPGVKDHIMSFVGNINELETDEKSNIIDAVNSLIVDRIDNVENMEKLANAIGEPVTANHSVDEVVEGLGEMLSTFKTNMMNSGVMVESSDKFKQLIDKIKGLTEGEGNKGIQFAEGDCEFTANPNPTLLFEEYDLQLNTDFTPSILLLRIRDKNALGYSYEFIHAIIDSTVHNSQDSFAELVTSSPHTTRCYIDNNKFYAWSQDQKTYTVKWYAIGVGEEDTTLRDSLASILQEEGVNVTEEDDMASLIGKVDNEFDKQVIPEGTAVASNVDKGKTFINSTGKVVTGTSTKVAPAGTAVASDVVSGKTFINSTGQLLTGNIVNQPAITNAISVGKWKTDIYFRIPRGAYLTNSYDGYPEILCKATDIDSNIKPENIISGKSICGINGTANINSLGGFHRAYGDGLYNVNTYLNTLSINTNLNITYITNGFIIFDYLYVNSDLVRNVSLSVNLDTVINNITIRPSYNNGIISFTVSDTNVFANGVYSWCIYY